MFKTWVCQPGANSSLGILIGPLSSSMAPTLSMLPHCLHLSSNICMSIVSNCHASFLTVHSVTSTACLPALHRQNFSGAAASALGRAPFGAPPQC